LEADVACYISPRECPSDFGIMGFDSLHHPSGKGRFLLSSLGAPFAY
jgi:hypothetical protein